MVQNQNIKTKMDIGYCQKENGCLEKCNYQLSWRYLTVIYMSFSKNVEINCN